MGLLTIVQIWTTLRPPKFKNLSAQGIIFGTRSRGVGGISGIGPVFNDWRFVTTVEKIICKIFLIPATMPPMKCFSTAILASLIVTTPTINGYPSSDIPLISIQKPSAIPDLQRLSYDEIVDLLALIESDSFEEKCSIDELDQVNRLLSVLAIEGAAEDEKVDVAIAATSLFQTDDSQYACWTVQPAIFRNGSADIVLCKSWFKKQWDQTRKFVQKHKKAIIIGAIVVVAVTVVVVAAVAISSTAAAGAAASGIVASASAAQQKPPHTSSLEEQISTFKETVAQNQLDCSGISIEENGRMVGSLFTHQTVDLLMNQIRENPHLGDELQNIGLNLQGPPPKWASGSPHLSIDSAFSTNYSLTYVPNTDLNTLTYQTRGEWALSSGYYAQAVQDFGMAIEREPNHPDSYLGRGVANFELGHYEESVSDYRQFVFQTKEPFSVTDFSIGFAKGLPQGIYHSGEGMLLFVTDLACHPIQTSEKVYESLATLSRLVKSGEWDLVAEALSPELHQLVSEWDTLSAIEKGELSGYAFGKHGADILLPGGAAKAVAKGSVAAKELGAICKNLQSAEKLLVLEAMAEGGSTGVNIGEVIASANRAITAGEELGFTAKEVAGLKQSGELERIIVKGRDFFTGNPELQASYDLFKNAKEMLEPYVRKPMPEPNIRHLIHQSGIPTFERPVGIPENYLVRITEKGAGMEYVHPTNKALSIRVMPGKPHSPNPLQQKPYIVQIIDKTAIDRNGNLVSSRSPEAHIPLDLFIYREEMVCAPK